MITRAVMQAGLSWAFIDGTWDNYVRAFDNFDCRRVAAYGDFDVERLMTTDGIIHSKSKIEGTIKNARTLIALETEFGSLRAYQASLRPTMTPAKTRRNASPSWATFNTYYWRFRTGAISSRSGRMDEGPGA